MCQAQTTAAAALSPTVRTHEPMKRLWTIIGHGWDVEEHPSLKNAANAKAGHGRLLFFRVDHFDDALLSARALVSRLQEEPHMNPSTGTLEFSLRDPDGYYVTVSSLNPVHP